MTIFLTLLSVSALYIIYSAIKSSRKSKEIRDISLMLSAAGASGSMQSLLLQTNPASAHERLVKLIKTNGSLRKVLKRNAADDNAIRSILRTLSAAGSGWEAGHYVPVSALSFPFTLDYVLKRTKNGSDQSWETAMDCIATLSDYFRQRKVGPVQ